MVPTASSDDRSTRSAVTVRRPGLASTTVDSLVLSDLGFSLFSRYSHARGNRPIDRFCDAVQLFILGADSVPQKGPGRLSLDIARFPAPAAAVNPWFDADRPIFAAGPQRWAGAPPGGAGSVRPVRQTMIDMTRRVLRVPRIGITGHIGLRGAPGSRP